MKNQIDYPIRIAQVMGKWLGGGVEAVVMNYYRNINKSQIQFDFICDNDSTNIPYDEIKRMGGKIYLVPPYQDLINYQKELFKLFKENNYKIVHSHINTLSVFPLMAAKRAGVPIRIAHSHSTSNKTEWKKNILKNILKCFSKVYPTHYFACTRFAGNYLFGDRVSEQRQLHIINNAIDIDKFKYNVEARNKIRSQLGIDENCILIGHIGRFVQQKNHEFLIEVFKKIHDINSNYKLVLVGQGPLKDEIKERVANFSLEKSVFFLGQRDDVNLIYQGLDLFLFPSLYEGLGMVVVEAQVSGLKCICSTEIPSDANLTEKVIFIDLNKGSDYWAKQIIDINCKNSAERFDDSLIISQKGYSIKNEAKKLEDIYILNYIMENI